MKPLDEVIDALDETTLHALAGHLASFVTPERLAAIDRALANRTRHITVVLEDIYQMHNASAVVRSCECFGMQDLHVIEAGNRFEVNKSIVQGAAKWVTIRRHRGPAPTRRCLEGLKEDGYRIVAMNPEPDSLPIDELPLERPLALCFGSEEPGLSRQALDLADMTATIPMQGFTRSLNLSVSAGITLRHLGTRLRRSGGEWNLDTGRRNRLRALWLARSISAGRHIVARYLGNADS